MADEVQSHTSRRSVRFLPDAGHFAIVDTVPTRPDGSFWPSIVALVSDESARGAGLVVLNTLALQDGDLCRIQVGLLPALRARVCHRTDVVAGVVRIGLEYLD